MVDENIGRYNVQLVVKGYIRVEGIDYEKMFIPEERVSSICLYLAMVVHLDLELY